MVRPITEVLLAVICLLTFSCSRNLEDLIQEKDLQDSLQNRIPSIEILSPGVLEEVFSPVFLRYEIKNWELEVGGRHVQIFVNGENRSLTYHHSQVFIHLDTGHHRLSLVLAHPDFSLTTVSDSLRVDVIPLPDSIHILNVIHGTGSGFYPQGVLVEISANEIEFRKFRIWTSPNGFITDPHSPLTFFEMPDRDASVTAIFDTIFIDYEQEIKPIFEAECYSCHSGLSPPDLSTCEAIKANSNIILDRLESSVNGMPPNGPLPKSQIDLIKEWIDQDPKCN